MRRRQGLPAVSHGGLLWIGRVDLAVAALAVLVENRMASTGSWKDGENGWPQVKGGDYCAGDFWRRSVWS